MTNKIFLNWEELHADLRILAQEISQKGSFSKIVAVSRGGLVPAGVLAYLLDIRHVITINVSSYDKDKQQRLEMLENPEKIEQIDEKTLIVDDLVDSGQTFAFLKEFFPKATYACVYAKRRGKTLADFYAKELPDQWVVFPWDI